MRKKEYKEENGSIKERKEKNKRTYTKRIYERKRGIIKE